MPLPAHLASDVIPVSYLAPAAQPAAGKEPTPEIIAASTPATPAAPAAEEDDANQPSLFAVDRLVTSSGLGAAPRTVQASWSPGTWTQAPPPAPTPAPDAFTPAPLEDQSLPFPDVAPLPYRFYASAEYLLWWLKGEHIPPLVTAGSASDLVPGALGQPGTAVLFGDTSINSGVRSGGRFRVGYWLDPWGQYAVELGGFFLGQQRTRFTASSAFNPVLARPFLAVNTNTQFAQLVALPGTATGNVTVNAPSNFWGAEANLLCNLCCGCNYRVNLLGGFRYLGLNESLAITENVQELPTAPPPFTNARVTVFDRFATLNQFYGGQVGAAATYFWGRLSLGVRGTVALGDTHQVLDIEGSQRIVAANGTVTTANGGLLALSSNSGHFNRDRFTVVPEIGINLGYQVTPRLRAFVGYNFLYWSNVLRPGDQIDTNIDITKIPNFPVAGAQPTGQNHPGVPFHGTDIWAQGISFGILFTY
jgi:hypothetical protein